MGDGEHSLRSAAGKTSYVTRLPSSAERSGTTAPSARETQKGATDSANTQNVQQTPVRPLATNLPDNASLREVEEVFENIDFDLMADELSEKSSTQDMEESELLSSLQVVTEASRRHANAGDLPTALRTLRQAIVERRQVNAVVRNGGLYPLVSCALVKEKDEETSLLTLQVALRSRCEAGVAGDHGVRREDAQAADDDGHSLRAHALHRRGLPVVQRGEERAADAGQRAADGDMRGAAERVVRR